MDWNLDELKHSGQIETLDELQWAVEDRIGNYAITHSEDLLDEEEECVSRLIVFNHGTTDYRFVFTPAGFIRFFDERMPTSLTVDIHNAFVEYQVNPYSSDELGTI